MLFRSGSLSTIHANSAKDVLARLETMILMGFEIPLEAIRKQISATVYRDGSRSGVLISTKKEKKDEDKKDSLEPLSTVRPKELEADVVKFQNNKEKWIAFIGLKDGAPYEIFTGLADDVKLM